jgi:hypothetical protein
LFDDLASLRSFRAFFIRMLQIFYDFQRLEKLLQTKNKEYRTFPRQNVIDKDPIDFMSRFVKIVVK